MKKKVTIETDKIVSLEEIASMFEADNQVEQITIDYSNSELADEYDMPKFSRKEVSEIIRIKSY